MEPNIWSRLMSYYTFDEALLWLSSPHPQLNNDVPAALLATEDEAQISRIREVLARLDADAYI